MVLEEDERKKYARRGGKYINRLNTTNLDLTKYQIGRTIEEHR